MKMFLKIVIGILAVLGVIILALFVYGMILGVKEAAQKPSPPTAQIPTAPAPTVEEKVTQKEPQENLFNDMGFRMNYPKDWVTEKPNEFTVIFSGPRGTDAFFTTVNVQILASTKIGGKHTSMDSVIQSLRSQIMTAQNPTLTDTEDQSFTSKSGKNIAAKGFMAVYTRQNETFKQLQFVSPSADGEVFYAYSYTAPQNLYDQYKTTAISMIESLELLK